MLTPKFTHKTPTSENIFANKPAILCNFFGNFKIILKYFYIKKYGLVGVMLRRGSALGFPRGEAVAKIGSSEPILVTEEECGQ